jgi:spore maturation protein CgeB
MRWLVAHPGPQWSVHDVFIGWTEALRELGEQVHCFNLDDRLAFFDSAVLPVGGDLRDPGTHQFKKALTPDDATSLAVDGLAGALWKIRPDILLIISGFLIPHDMLDHARRTGTRVVVMHTEQPYELERELALAAHADLNLINDPLHIEKFGHVAPTVFAPHAYRPSVHYPGTSAIRSDFCFVGTGFGSRRWFFEQMHEAGDLDGLDVLFAGPWYGLPADSPMMRYLAADDPEQACDNDQSAEIYRGGEVGINLYRREHDNGSTAAGLAMGPREVEMAACGLFFLRDPRPEGDQILPMLPTFAGPAEAGELLSWWLKHDTEREQAALQAREAIQDRTFTASATQLLRFFDQQPVTT